MKLSSLRRLAILATAIAALAWVALAICAFAAIWIVDAEMSQRLQTTAFGLFFVALPATGVAGGLWSESGASS